MGFKPRSLTVCDWCGTAIQLDKDLERYRSGVFHRGCAEDLRRSESEVAEVKEATERFDAAVREINR